jgi:hypothetical protein
MMPIQQQNEANKAQNVMNAECISLREAIGILSTAKPSLDWFEFWMDYAQQHNTVHVKN